MKTSDFYFDLPEELIAQEPLADRASSRLMVVHKDSGRREHRHFRDIKEYLRAGDCLVINNTKVLPARLYGERVGTGAAMEILLLVRKDMDTWEVLVRPGKKARPGDRISFGGGKLIAEVLEVIEGGNRIIKFEYTGVFENILEELGGYSESKDTLRVEDYDLWVRMYAAGYRGFNTQEILYSMRDDRNAISRRTFQSRINESKVILRAGKAFGFKRKACLYSAIPIIKSACPQFVYKIVHKHRLNRE